MPPGRDTLHGGFLHRDSRAVAVADSLGLGHGDVNGIADLVVAVHFVVAQALHFKVRCFEVRVGYDQHPGLADQLDLGQRGAFLIEQVGGYVHRHYCPYLDAAVLDGFLLEQAQDRQREGLGVADRALAGTARADDCTGFAQ